MLTIGGGMTTAVCEFYVIYANALDLGCVIMYFSFHVYCPGVNEGKNVSLKYNDATVIYDITLCSSG